MIPEGKPPALLSFSEAGREKASRFVPFRVVSSSVERFSDKEEVDSSTLSRPTLRQAQCKTLRLVKRVIEEKFILSLPKELYHDPLQTL